MIKCANVSLPPKCGLIIVYYVFQDKIKNEEVLRQILYIIQKRKLEYLGHIMRNPKFKLSKIIFQAKREEKVGVGRRIDSPLKNYLLNSFVSQKYKSPY